MLCTSSFVDDVVFSHTVAMHMRRAYGGTLKVTYHGAALEAETDVYDFLVYATF